MFKYKEFISMFLNEGGNAVEEARPLFQDEVIETYKWIEKNIFPKLGLVGEGTDAFPIGSYGKKVQDQTSGDIDIAVSIDKIAGVNGISLDTVLDWLDTKLKSLGYSTKMARGFSQVSFGAPINGNFKNGIAQIDLMLSSNLDWSRFMYYSPNFIEAESKYKGMYRNTLLMSIVSESMREVTKTAPTGEVEEYKSYVIRLEKGIYQVAKTFMGKKGSLIKTATLLHNQDKFITNTPAEVVKFAFGEGVNPSDVMTFENVWKLLIDPNFIHSGKIVNILKRFRDYLLAAKMPIPSEATSEFPNIF